MGWQFFASESLRSRTFHLPNEGIAHISRTGTLGLEVINTPPRPPLHTLLGCITVKSCGLKVEALHGTLSILPGHASPTISTHLDPRTEKYELQPRTEEHSEAIFLRHGDIISSSVTPGTLTCKYTTSEVQVHSSATGAVPIADSTPVDIAETPEDETEDEEQDLDHTTNAAVRGHKRSMPQATPRLSNQRSIVVQETPTAARVTEPTNPTELSIANSRTEPVETSSPEPKFKVEPEADGEAFSTAQESGPASPHGASISGLNEPPATSDVHMDYEPPHGSKSKSSLQVRIPPKRSVKRSSSGDEREESVEPEVRSSKRAKKDIPSEDGTQDSRISNIDVVPRKTTAKGKNRLSKVAEEEPAPSRSQKSSQRSTNMSTEPYDGPTPPRVASSNSSLTKSSAAVKFLKKQGGAYVESLNDNFNILCVRNGGLHKTPKVLHAIARGAPIVTDSWLLDCAKAERLVSLHSYTPSASDQEKEWKFKLDDVLGQPQSPFEGYTIHFTKSLKTIYKPFSEIEEVCKAAGAKKVTSSRMDKTGDIIVLAKEDDDAEAQKLMQDGVTCYTRDLVTFSILRGSLDLDSKEFQIQPLTEDAPKEKKKRGRKST